VYSWGAGGNGQLGHGDGVRHSHPTRIRSLERIATISAGETHAAAVNQCVIS
jgi:alpha-tubulin suppressor-like RCC1 family protein